LREHLADTAESRRPPARTERELRERAAALSQEAAARSHDRLSDMPADSHAIGVQDAEAGGHMVACW
jgi:hypothetical protein